MHASTIALAIFGVAGTASAIQFTSPVANATVARGEAKHEVSWSSVDTDPERFSIYLVNFVNWPPYYKQLAADVETAAGAAEIRIPCDLDASGGYQINAINGTNVYVIYAQTPKFSIGGASCQDPVAAEPSTCAPAVTVTATVTVSPTPLHSNGTLVQHPPSVTPPAAVTTTTVSTVNAGTCPETIGWGTSGYGSPITLTAVPRPSDEPTIPAPANAALTTSAPTSVSEKTVGNVVYQTVYMDLADYIAKGGSCGCDA
ncbi:hypothetical protein MCOR27_004108 [Pyricularia oryzae]|uniref:Yeast cell wall synthesis Kre9/Knh1-like N-terminal domain-containing protein n=2 Tax=Pyricularia TaxID=48558 RepID=A0ABQ8NY89_PYRGI|nr:hypothetical protein MCOR01_009316 [Pyricularia oryzae]KAI6303796.1 hypothetical protein MCOR33_001148 [Pyricularia grisea]KAH9437429.1 hypothetical protein MCOR02_001086 [Pyricularia oryzae]KAI6259456.1 hypothetical protein MCOR19_004193 [Pyricularia oryzae]KAI6280467.1 hypothetical protein MCOR26_003707 [Pyricularia oryzae]